MCLGQSWPDPSPGRSVCEGLQGAGSMELTKMSALHVVNEKARAILVGLWQPCLPDPGNCQHGVAHSNQDSCFCSSLARPGWRCSLLKKLPQLFDL